MNNIDKAAEKQTIEQVAEQEARKRYTLPPDSRNWATPLKNRRNFVRGFIAGAEKILEFAKGEKLNLESTKDTLTDESKLTETVREEWVSVNERLPEENIESIVFAHYDIIHGEDPKLYTDLTSAYWDGNVFHKCNGHVIPMVTHWMPLPLPPKPTEI